MAAAAAFLLRKPEMAVAGAPGVSVPGGAVPSGGAVYAAPSTPAAKKTALLSALKEELFALESEKLSDTISPVEYAEAKAALETVLKRALRKS